MLKNYNFNSMLSGCHAVMDTLGLTNKTLNVVECIDEIGKYYCDNIDDEGLNTIAKRHLSNEHTLTDSIAFIMEIYKHSNSSDPSDPISVKSISVVKNPNKDPQFYSELIDYSGMIVRVVTQDDALYDITTGKDGEIVNVSEAK